MNILHNKYDAIENLIYSEGLMIESLDISPKLDIIYVRLNHDITFIIPTAFYKGLKNASAKQLKHFKLIGNGTGIHWPDLDEDLSLKGFLKEYLLQKVKTERELIIA